ncbi:MAG: peroxiredoxin [Elusimicrobiota bacterium]|nr:peroxiredoxin [Elusimicrobiota bacterium]
MTTAAETANLRLGDTAPDFIADSTIGKLEFHKWLGDSWGVFFSHPKDFTPVCTTELGEAAKRSADFKKRNVKVLALSVDSVASHDKWKGDIEETQKCLVDYPIVGDGSKRVANLYGMIHPNASDSFTVRTVFVVDPKKKIRLTMTYPASTGRNFDEILRVIDALQLSDAHKVATPVNWQDGDDCIIPPAIQDPEELKTNYPKGFKTIKPYFRVTPQPNK